MPTVAQLTRWTIALTLGRPVWTDTPEEEQVVARLREEIVAIRARGDMVDLPVEWPALNRDPDPPA